jgi:hypothetical protein
MLLMLLATWSAVQAASSDELLEIAELAYAQGDLTTAGATAKDVVLLGDDHEAAAAQRLLVELAVRTGERDAAWTHLAGYIQRIPPDEKDSAWIERVSLRIQCDAAERRGDLVEARTLFGELETSGPMGVQEQVWAEWARARLAIREAEFANDYHSMLALVDDVEVWPDSPEERWLAFAHARAQFGLAEAICDWSAATQAVASVEGPHSEDERAWRTFAEGRLELRRAAAAGNLDAAERQVQSLLKRADLGVRERAWAEGYTLWLEREQLRVAGEDIPQRLTDGVSEWRVQFTELGQCELHPSEGLRRTTKVADQANADVSTWSLHLDLGVGLLGWHVDEDVVIKSDFAYSGGLERPGIPTTLVVNASATWRPVPIGETTQFGFSGFARGSVLLAPSTFLSGAVALGPQIAWRRLTAGAWAGAWTMSVPGTRSASGPNVPPDICADDESSSGRQSPSCVEIVNQEQQVLWRLFSVKGAGGSVAFRPSEPLEIALHAGFGAAPRLPTIYYHSISHAWMAGGEIRWRTSLEPLMGVVSSYAVGAGPLNVVDWGVAVGVGVER